MRLKIQCDEMLKNLQNFWQLNRAELETSAAA
jgi:hypothetical protein